LYVSLSHPDGIRILDGDDESVILELAKAFLEYSGEFRAGTSISAVTALASPAISREILDITGITIRETGEPGKNARFEIAVPETQYRSTT
jgi:hypothetical protein